MEHLMTSSPQARLFVGMGGSGMKTLSHFVNLLTEHAEESVNSEVFMAYLLVDTDAGELAVCEKEIRQAYSRIHREPNIRTVLISADITDFSSFVASKLKKGGHHPRLRETWWYRTNRKGVHEPFTALNLKDSPTRGAGQCPQVSTFLAWNQMRLIETTIDDILNTLKNRSVQGKNLQNWTLEVSLVSSLAGGTGRGCWHLVSSKIREKLRDLNQRPKPVGFFFDSSVFGETVKREEQTMKLRVNSITGVSELIAWLRNEYERDTDLPSFQFTLPSMENPDDRSSDLIDTTKLNVTVAGEELLGVTGRAPISAAYLIFNAGKQGRLGTADAYYQSVASALYARLFQSTQTANINEAGHLNGLGSATISVPISGIRTYVQGYARQFLPTYFSQAAQQAQIARVVESFFDGIGLETLDTIPPKSDSIANNVIQRVYSSIVFELSKTKSELEKKLQPKTRDYKDAEGKAKTLTNWPKQNEDVIRDFVRKDLVNRLFGVRESDKSRSVGGSLGNLEVSVTQRVESDPHFFKRVYGGSETVSVTNPIAEATRLLLEQPSVKLRNATGTNTETLDITSYGTKLAIANKAVERLTAMLAHLDRRANDGSGAAKGRVLVSPAEALAKARSGLLKSAVTTDERDALLSSVDAWLISQSRQHLDDCLKDLLVNAKDEIVSMKRSLETVVSKLDSEVGKRKSKTDRSRENNFWTASDFDKILNPGTSSFDQGILSAQVLQAVERDDKLEEEFHRLMNLHQLAGFEVAKDRFIDAMQRWIDASSKASALDLGRKVLDIIDEHLEKMADQFVLPNDFYEKNFGFFETVKRLMRTWGQKMLDRAGAPQDIAKLRQVFENQFGCAFPNSSDGQPKELDDDDVIELAQNVCKAMAVRLGGRTDPLFQQRFDEGERPTYDSVAVVLPFESRFDAAFAREIDAEAKTNPQFSGAGHFKATATYKELEVGNPYTMFAYATQQFEDWRSDSGMARIASLEYYKIPAVLNWLRACEDPSGASVFVDGEELRDTYNIPTCRDIYGLGFISPLFVHDKTLKELRWSPWDQSKARSKDKRTERLDLLAYALLKTPPTDCATHFDAILKKAEWTLPLLAWRDGKPEDSTPPWHFTRRAIRECTEVTATKERDANHQAFAANNGYPSIRRCIDDLLANDTIAAAIAGEADIFMSHVLCNNEYADDFNADSDIRTAFRYLGDRLAEAKTKQDGPASEKMKKLIDELIARVAELGTYSPEKLKEHFEKIRRNSELQTSA